MRRLAAALALGLGIALLPASPAHAAFSCQLFIGNPYARPAVDGVAGRGAQQCVGDFGLNSVKVCMQASTRSHYVTISCGKWHRTTENQNPLPLSKGYRWTARCTDHVHGPVTWRIMVMGQGGGQSARDYSAGKNFECWSYKLA